MKTKAQVLRDNSQHAKLIRAVLKRIDKENIPDINRNGIGGGYGNFIYYADTHKFAMYYRKAIITMLEECADMLGEEVVSMVSKFGVFYDHRTKTSSMDDDDRRDLYLYLDGGKPKYHQITNLMAWFAAEEVCRMFEN